MTELTVITVVRNNLEGLKATYASLQEQANQDFYWLVMDGKSTDGTVEWMETVKDGPIRFISEKDKSLFDAMNKGIGRLETEYCIFLNGGDRFWDPGVTGRILDAIAKERFLVGYGDYVLGSVPGFKQRRRGRRIATLVDMFYGPVPCHQAMIISKRAFAEAGNYREDLGIYGDAEWILRYSKLRHPTQFTYLPFVVCFYHPEGLSYHHFLKHWKTFFAIMWRTGNLLEFLAGAMGWFKTGIYVLVSKALQRVPRSRKAAAAGRAGA